MNQGNEERRDRIKRRKGNKETRMKNEREKGKNKNGTE